MNLLYTNSSNIRKMQLCLINQYDEFDNTYQIYTEDLFFYTQSLYFIITQIMRSNVFIKIP